MRSPFPGMDPYLEDPGRWHGFHNSLIAAIQLDLAPRLRPRYVARIVEQAGSATTSATRRGPGRGGALTHGRGALAMIASEFQARPTAGDDLS